MLTQENMARAKIDKGRTTKRSNQTHNLDLSQQNAICHKLDGAVTPYQLIMPNLKTNFLSQLKA